MTLKRSIAGLLAALLCQAAQAQFYVGLEASATRLEEPRWRGQGAGLIVGWVAHRHLAFEVGARRLGSDHLVSREAAGHLIEATGLWRIPIDGVFNAYARAGVAQLRSGLADALPNGDRARPLVGLGLHVLVREPLALRVELQRVGSGLTGLRAGLVYPL